MIFELFANKGFIQFCWLLLENLEDIGFSNLKFTFSLILNVTYSFSEMTKDKDDLLIYDLQAIVNTVIELDREIAELITNVRIFIFKKKSIIWQLAVYFIIFH